jgi:hypothetical protein
METIRTGIIMAKYIKNTKKGVVMKSKLLIWTLAFALSSVSSVYAGSGHDHGYGGSAMSEQMAIIAVSRDIKDIISQEIKIEGEKLDKSWEDLPLSNKAINIKGTGYYIISLKNDTQRKTLYVLLSDKGEFYDANYSGTFEGM